MTNLTTENINQIVASKKSFAIVRLPNEESLHVKAGNWILTKLEDIKEDCFFVQPFAIDEMGFALAKNASNELKGTISVPLATERSTYDETFEKFMQEIQKGSIQKMVLSKVKKGSEEKMDIGASFFSLCENYPKAAVNLFFIPNQGLWMGASPELLVRTDQSKIESISLAGTLAPGKKTFSNKEKEEQKIVTDYMKEIFSKYDSSVSIHKQEIVNAGNVSHLCNHFELKVAYDQKIVNKIVNDLHPTPAINGSPKKEAMECILSVEKHDRELYAGYFGFVQPGIKTELYVNIRCMKIVDGIPYIFTGGGITKESNASAEWNEAELKAQGLINSLCIGEN